MTRFGIDLSSTPFSRRGSYLAVSRLAGTSKNGVFLRTLHGDAVRRELLRFVVGGSTAPQIRATAGRLGLSANGAAAELALEGSGRAVLRVTEGELTLDFEVQSKYDVVLQERHDTWRFIASGANRNYRIVIAGGTAHLEAGWDGLKGTSARLSVAAHSAPATITIDEFRMTAPAFSPSDLDVVAGEAEREFEHWLDLHGTAHGDPDLAAAARLAAYVTWSALVPPGGVLRRESMLMSKNNMAHIWSWDHCFNAIALARDPDAAAGQLLTLFDHQDDHGSLPDHIDDARVQPNFTKPPIHGWAIGYLMDRSKLSSRQLTAIYTPLVRWTEWWFAHRVYGGDGVPSYNHGNDSGWDNSTVFAAGVPLQSPDLLAFLALQLHTLARISDALGLPHGAGWRQRATDAVDLLLSHFWRGDRFVARDTLSGRDVDTESLLQLMPLVLGAELPRAQFDACVQRLLDGGFLTAHGAATEAVTSPLYEPDGYWRGPVWAPTTMLLIDGLRGGGRGDLAEELTERFLRTCAKSGMSENFDAVTGDGLRDGSMTWTASVYLTLLAQTQGNATRPAAHQQKLTGSVPETELQ